MSAGALTIRNMRIEDLQQAIDWAAAEGWNPGVHDAQAFFAADPQGFLVARCEGQNVASISVVAYPENFGFLGFYIVRPEYRGKGYGLRLWQAGMDYLEGRCVGLDGVPAQQDSYRKSGFAYAYGNQRYEGRGGGTAPPGLIAAAEVPSQMLLDYDTQCFGVPREAFLQAWIAQPEAAAVARMQDRQLLGYAVRRRCRVGHKVGPLFASNAHTAEQLFRALAASVPGEPLFLDVPLCNADAIALADRHDMQPMFETARMYTSAAPAMALERVFGVTSFELG